MITKMETIPEYCTTCKTKFDVTEDGVIHVMK
jgi:hypothetical protein